MLYSVSKFAILKLALRKGETRESWWSKVQDLQLIFWPGKPDYRKGKPGESQGRKVMGLKADACLHVSERTARQPKRQNQRKLATQSRGSKVVFHNLTMTARQPKSATAQRPLGSVPSAFFVLCSAHSVYFYILLTHNGWHPKPAAWQHAMKAKSLRVVKRQ